MLVEVPDLLLECTVEMILDRILRTERQLPGDLTPFVAEYPVVKKEDVILLSRPGVLLHLRTQMIEPSFPALLVRLRRYTELLPH